MKTERPYWHVDAKWITGIICFFILTGLLFNIAVWRLTTKKVAVPLLGKTIAYMYSRNGLNDQTEIDKFKIKISESPNGRLQPIPGTNIYVTLADLQGKSPMEVRLWLFNQVAEPIWSQKGVEKPLAKFGLLAFVSSRTNGIFFGTLVGQTVMILVFGSLFIYFSAGFGRIFGPGLLLFLTSSFNAIFWGATQLITKSLKISTIPFLGEGSADMAKQLSGAIQFVAPDIVRVFYLTYIWALSIGVILMISAGLLKLIFVKKQSIK